MGVLVLLAVVVVASAVVLAAVIAARNKASFTNANELIPGVATKAPAAWAGSHDPEARLHRRLRDALAALRANQAFDNDGALLDLRVELEHEALQVDEQLVATAALPVHLRRAPLDQITAAVVSLEQAVADLAGSSAAESSARLSRVLEDVRGRTGLVAQARAALDDLSATEVPAVDAHPSDIGTDASGAQPPEEQDGQVGLGT